MVVKPRSAALLLAAGLLCAPARANDSAAELDAGGLVLRREPGIALTSEDLSIALDRITVSDRFRNQTDTARTVRIAFPLPPIDGRVLSFAALKLLQAGTANFVGFTVTVDGQPVEPELEERAFVVPYIVTTAPNWAAPIGRFTLTVDKGSPEAVASFCRTGVRKTGPTTFRWEARDYVPDQDLRVLYVLPGSGPTGIR